MADNSFGNEEYQTTREQLIRMINESLTPEDKEFLLAFSKGEPDWTKVDYSKFPVLRTRREIKRNAIDNQFIMIQRSQRRVSRDKKAVSLGHVCP